MSIDTKIQFDEKEIQKHENIDAILSTATEIMKATESDYNHIKEKNTFKRAIDLFTLSKDNQKILAKNIKNLAAMQAILLKLLRMLSKDCQQIAQWVTENEAAIERLSVNDIRLAEGLSSLRKEILRIKYGYYERPNIATVSAKSRFIIISTVREFIKRSGKSNSNTQIYMRNLRKVMPCTYKSDSFNYRFVEDMENPRDHELLFIILSEVTALMVKPLMGEYNEIIKHITISDTKKESIKKDIEKTIEIEGRKFLIDFYLLYIEDTDADLIRDEDIENAGDPNSENKSLNEDSNQNDYSQIRELVLDKFYQIAPEENKESKRKNQGKRIQVFIQKVAPRVVPETAIAYVDCSLLGASDTGILFTTSAIHYKSLNKDAVSFKYNEVDFENSKLMYDSKGTNISLSIALLGKEHRVVISENLLKKDILLDLLNEISTRSNSAPSDTPAYINDVDIELKVLCVKALLNMFIDCNQDITEVVRFASDISVPEKEIEEILKYAEKPDEEIVNILDHISKTSPYPSKLCIGYTLIEEFVRLLQMEKKRTEITAKERKCIKTIAGFYDLNDEVIDKLVSCAQIPYRIINDGISIKEINRINKDLAKILISTGISFATVFGSSVFFWNLWWGLFIPGLGAIINAVFGSIIVAKEITDKFLQKVEHDNYKKKLIQDVTYSYSIVIDFLRKVYFEDLSLDIEKIVKRLEQSQKFYLSLMNAEQKIVTPEQYKKIIEKIKDIIQNENYASGNFYINPDIPDGIVNKATKYITFDEQVTQIIAIIDSTVSGSLRCGIVFTNKGFYYKKAINQPKKYISYVNIKNIQKKAKGINSFVTVYTNSGEIVEWADFPLYQASVLYTIITNILQILRSS